MNNTFNIHRFGLLLKRQWLEFGKIYLISLMVVLGIFLSFYGLAYYKLSTCCEIDTPDAVHYYNRTINFREPVFIIVGLLFITIVASSYFANLGQKSKAIIELLIPASTFEKFLTALFFTVVLSTISFITLFYLTDLAFITSFQSKSDSIQYFFSKNTEYIFKPILVAPLLITSIFLLGSIYFNKFHYLRTAISIMIFSVISGSILVKAGEWLFSGKIRINGGNRSLDHMSQNTAEWLGVVLIIVLTAVFWSIAYVRLKEKEV